MKTSRNKPFNSTPTSQSNPDIFWSAIPASSETNSIQEGVYIVAFETVLKKQKENKTGTSQVSAISKAQKAQNIFGKNLKVSKKISFGKCRTVPKDVKGGPFLIYKHAFCSKITKKLKGGTLWGH